jgi:hypothetical protein
VRIRNLFGYLNLRSLVHAETKYDWLIDGVMSQADGNEGLGPQDAPFYITSQQDITIRHVTIASNLKSDPEKPRIPLIYIEVGRAGESGQEWYRGHIKLHDLTLAGTNSDAVYITGDGFVDINNLHAGSTGDQSFYGGPPTIAGYCVNAAGPGTDVYVTGGFCNSDLGSGTGATREEKLRARKTWMHNVSEP